MTPLFRTICLRCRHVAEPGYATACPSCGGMIDIEYDLDRVRLRDSNNPYERFADLLPVIDRGLLPAGARATPTRHARVLGERIGLRWLYLKDETAHPTSTTKDRMAGVALPYLYEHGVRAFAVSSTGNSSTAYAHALARTPLLHGHVFTADRFARRVDLPPAAPVTHHVIEGATFVEAAAHARRYAIENGIVDEGGFFNPSRREGLKLAWLEATEQVPRPIDWYVQAISSAMGVYGVYKGARELRAMGRADRLPRLLCVQQETCAPMVSAWMSGSTEIRPEDIVPRPDGIAPEILRGDPSRAYPQIRPLVVESGGAFVAVSEDEIRQAHGWLERLEGMHACYAAAAAVAGLSKRARSGAFAPDDTVLVNITGGERHARPAAAAASVNHERTR